MEMIHEEKQSKILFVANVAKEHILKFHVPTIRMLADEGWIVDVACSGEDEVPYCNRQFRMSYKRSPFNLALFRGISELKKIINDGEYDIIYCHTPVGGLAARLAARKARKRGTKVVYFAHGYHFFKGAPKVNWLIYYTIEKVMSYITDGIILINREDYELTKKRFRRPRAHLVDGVGVDTSRLDVTDAAAQRARYRKELRIPENATVLIYLAELVPNKNQTFLMRVLKRVMLKRNDVYLVLAGFDHTDGEFERYAERIGVERRVKILGWREDVGALCNMADICTATSVREGFGLNLVEAMYCGLPVIASRNRGHETIIRDGENGFLVDLGDEAAYADRILTLADDMELRDKFILEGKKESGKYSAEAVLHDLREILEIYR